MSLSVEDLCKDLESFEGVTIEDEGDFLTVRMAYEPGKPGKDKWNAINNILKNYGGEWISNRAWSHWKIPKTQENKIPNLEKDSMVRDAIDLMERALTLLRKAGY